MWSVIYIASIITACIILPVESVSRYDPVVRIVGGETAEPHSAPYMVRLVTNRFNFTSGEYYKYFCAGSVLARRIVLTAAHCLGEAAATVAYFGKHNISVVEDGEVKEFSNRFIRHDSADIALIVLSYPLAKFTSTIKSILLPTRRDVSRDYLGESATAYGWGKTSNTNKSSEVLRKGNFKVISNADCERQLNAFNLSLSEGEFCSSGANKVGTCGGDSGGPLVRGIRQIGVMSWGPQNCEGGGPSVYVNISAYRDWIHEVTHIRLD